MKPTVTSYCLANLTWNQADFIFHQVIEGLDSCDVKPHTACDVCKDRVAIIQQLVDQGVRNGYDYRDTKKKWGIRDNSYEYQQWLKR